MTTVRMGISGPAMGYGLYQAGFEPGTRFFYVYTNSGREGQWEGVDVPELRHFIVPAAAGGRSIAPLRHSALFLFRQTAGTPTRTGTS